MPGCVFEELVPHLNLLTKRVFRLAQASQYAVASVRVGLPLLVSLKDDLEVVLGVSSLLLGIPKITLEDYVLNL